MENSNKRNRLRISKLTVNKKKKQAASMDSKSFDKHRKLMLEFIDLFRSMPCLWDRQHPGYAVRQYRTEAYKMLLQKYREIDEDATLHTVRSRLDIVRNGFIRELKKVRLSREMTSDPSMQYIPRLWYYGSCTFLENQYLPVKDTRTANTPESHYDNDEENESNNDFDDSHSTKIEYLEESSNSYIDHDDAPSGKRSKVEPLLKLENTEDSPSKYSDEEWECMGKAIALQMRELTPYQSAIANKLISDAVFYGKLGKLTIDAHIALNSTENRDTDYS